MSKRTMIIVSVAVLALTVAGVSLASPMGMGMMGGGRGMGGGGGWMRGGRGVARDLITPDERAAHQAKMRNVKTYDECLAAQTEFRGVMEVRAKEKGVTLPSPRQNRCEIMKNRGLIK